MIDFIEDLQNRTIEGFANPCLLASLIASFSAFVSHTELSSLAGHFLFQRKKSSVL